MAGRPRHVAWTNFNSTAGSYAFRTHEAFEHSMVEPDFNREFTRRFVPRSMIGLFAVLPPRDQGCPPQRALPACNCAVRDQSSVATVHPQSAVVYGLVPYPDFCRLPCRPPPPSPVTPGNSMGVAQVSPAHRGLQFHGDIPPFEGRWDDGAIGTGTRRHAGYFAPRGQGPRADRDDNTGKRAGRPDAGTCAGARRAARAVA